MNRCRPRFVPPTACTPACRRPRRSGHQRRPSSATPGPAGGRRAGAAPSLWTSGLPASPRCACGCSRPAPAATPRGADGAWRSTIGHPRVAVDRGIPVDQTCHRHLRPAGPQPPELLEQAGHRPARPPVGVGAAPERPRQQARAIGGAAGRGQVAGERRIFVRRDLQQHHHRQAGRRRPAGEITQEPGDLLGAVNLAEQHGQPRSQQLRRTPDGGSTGWAVRPAIPDGPDQRGQQQHQRQRVNRRRAARI